MSARRFAPSRPVEVIADPRTGEPRRLRWRGRAERVARVEESWTIETGWWSGEPEAARRRYYRLLTRDGLLCTLYRDLSCGRWYLELIVD